MPIFNQIFRFGIVAFDLTLLLSSALELWSIENTVKFHYPKPHHQEPHRPPKRWDDPGYPKVSL
jgi:hypothetical protein